VHDVVGAAPARLAWIEALHSLLARDGGGNELELPTAPSSLFSGCGIDDPRERVAASVEERLRTLDDPPSLVHRAAGREGGPFAALAGRLFAGHTRSTTATTATSARPTIVEAASVAVATDVVACEAARAIRAG